MGVFYIAYIVVLTLNAVGLLHWSPWILMIPIYPVILIYFVGCIMKWFDI